MALTFFLTSSEVSSGELMLISSDLVEVLKMSDRVVVMSEGEVAAVLDNDSSLTQETILTYAINGGI